MGQADGTGWRDRGDTVSLRQHGSCSVCSVQRMSAHKWTFVLVSLVLLFNIRSRPRGEEVEKLRRPLPFVPQTARTTRFQRSYPSYALNYRYSSTAYSFCCIMMQFCFYCVLCWSSLQADMFNKSKCVCVCSLLGNKIKKLNFNVMRCFTMVTSGS